MTAAELEARIVAAGYVVTLAGRVSSATAAAVLGITPSRLRAWRAEGRGPPYSGRGGRCWYAVSDLAAWLDRDRA